VPPDSNCGPTATTAVGASADQDPVITDRDFERFSDYFHRRTGIRFGTGKRYFVDQRLQQCIREAGERSFAAWFGTLRRETAPRRWQDTINHLTVNETYFLRENDQLTGLADTLLPSLLADGERLRRGVPIRILCLPCATGEEPYSVALTLLETWPEVHRISVRIVGADIDSDVLSAARAGWYGERAVHRVPPAWLGAHFTSDGPGHYKINASIAESVDFRLANLADPACMGRLGTFDVIFCRNVLIYFDEESRRAAIGNLSAGLRPGGFLVLGRTESIRAVPTALTPRRFGFGTVHQQLGATGH
jgi:chemotaxis protein methyltransferase CheR